MPPQLFSYCRGAKDHLSITQMLILEGEVSADDVDEYAPSCLVANCYRLRYRYSVPKIRRAGTCSCPGSVTTARATSMSTGTADWS